MTSPARDPAIDSTLALWREGYLFIPRRCRRFSSDLFSTRLLGQRVICMSGAEAAALFYDPRRFQRAGAVPLRVQRTLMGRRGVQTLDGGAHGHRKALFMSLMSASAVRRFGEAAARHWDARIGVWEGGGRVVLFDEALGVLCRAACEWTGVPLPEDDVPRRAHDLAAMVDAFGAIGPRHWWGRRARRRSERWIERIIGQVRSGRLAAPAGTPLAAVAGHRELDGRMLDAPVAAVELLNLIRPIVAIAWYVAFAALALERFPQRRLELEAGDDAGIHPFVHEVRRFYPFAPFLGARVRDEFGWNGIVFDRGRLVLLDIYGTNRDPRGWTQPGEFQPARFAHAGPAPSTSFPRAAETTTRGTDVQGSGSRLKA